MVFQIHGGLAAQFSVLVQTDDERQEVDWMDLPADRFPTLIRATSIGYVTLYHDTLGREATGMFSDIRVRLRFETGPTTGVWFSSGIDRRR